MLFNSAAFLLFFPVVVILYYLCPHRWRWALLLLASYYFYMSWNPWYILLIVSSTLIDFIAGGQMSRLPDKRKRLPWLLLSLGANLGMLFFFKYYNFFIDNINASLDVGWSYSDFLLPVGISFYTFQTLSYSIDIYQGKLQREKHLGRFALFVSFFPQLVAGPIERAKNLLPQLREKVVCRYENFSAGGQRIIWGFFKKVVIADNIAFVVDEIYGAPESYSSVGLLLASYLFAVQIYCDFSGYSDIAIGTARILGIDLMKNFRTPYWATSVREFWSRWHISLSTWFRDYVYIPLGGNQRGYRRMLINLIIVFVVSGFWHGANWTFLIWGAIHGLLLIIERLLGWGKRRESQGRIIKVVRAFILFQLVTLAWVFFRAENISEAGFIISEILSFNLDASALLEFTSVRGHGYYLLRILFVAGFIILDPWFETLLDQKTTLPVWVKRPLYATLIAVILVFGFWGEVEFIYFQF